MAECGKSVGMVFGFEVEAANREPMPDGLSIVDAAAYQALANLYARYKAGFIDKDSAIKEKKKIQKSWKDGKVSDELNRYHVKLDRDTEAAKSAFLKNKTIENAERLIKIMDGIIRP